MISQRLRSPGILDATPNLHAGYRCCAACAFAHLYTFFPILSAREACAKDNHLYPVWGDDTIWKMLGQLCSMLSSHQQKPSATSGIGAAIAQAFAREGAQVVITGRNAERGQAVALRIREAGGTAHFVTADLTSRKNIDHLVSETCQMASLVFPLYETFTHPKEKAL
jgi:short chain dehydrogenase